ncbi:MAG: hypothetical protein K5821_11705 [Nitrobacter sp.]|nr:hypothetical protein [Nitrobacter sp.]
MLNEIICNAIKSKNLLGFRYKGELRCVEPHLLGENKKGNRRVERMADRRGQRTSVARFRN